MANLSEEVIVEILLRLPVTSLCRFRCVSKQWLSLISDTKFIKTHLNRNTNEHEHERLVLVSAQVLGSCDLYSVDLKSFQFLDDFEAVHLKFPPKQISRGCYVILGSCDGLLLMLDVDDYISCFLVNPSTRECKELPKSPFQCHPDCFFDSYGLGYDSSNDDYKVVRISHYAEGVDDIVSVYTLRTNSWRRIEDSPLFKGPSPGILVSGALHWFACSGVGSNKATVIASFDLADENFRDVPFAGFVDDFFSFKELNVVGGCLCVVVSSRIGFTDVWVMKEYGVRDSWTKLTINYNNNFPLCKPLCLSATGEFLLQNQDKMVPKLVLYNPQEKTSKELVVRGGPNYYEAGIYIESLVSPNCSNMIMKQ